MLLRSIEPHIPYSASYGNDSVCLTAARPHYRAGQGRAGQGRAGQGRAGQGRAGQGRAGQGRAGQGRAGQGRAGQGRAGQGRAGQGRAGQGRAGQGRAGQGGAGQGRGRGNKQRLYTPSKANMKQDRFSNGRMGTSHIRKLIMMTDSSESSPYAAYPINADGRYVRVSCAYSIQMAFFIVTMDGGFAVACSSGIRVFLQTMNKLNTRKGTLCLWGQQ